MVRDQLIKHTDREIARWRGICDPKSLCVLYRGLLFRDVAPTTILLITSAVHLLIQTLHALSGLSEVLERFHLYARFLLSAKTAIKSGEAVVSD